MSKNTLNSFLLIGCLIVSLSAARLLPAQGVSLNGDGASPDASALLDMKSSTQGFLPPRMTASQRTAIRTPANGLMVYQTDADSGFWYYDGSQWQGMVKREDIHPSGGVAYLPIRDDVGMAAKGYSFMGDYPVNSQVQKWDGISSTNAPSGRQDHAAIWTGDEMLIWGGKGGNNQVFGDGKKYNPASDTWSDISNVNAPVPRKAFSFVWTGTQMIIWGGEGASGTKLNDGAIYDCATDSWTPLSLTGAPLARSHHTATWTGTEMIIFGGEGSILLARDYAKKYTLATHTWSAISSSNIPSLRTQHTAVWTGSEMIIWGGLNGSQIELNTGSIYTPATNTWTTMNTASFASPRSMHTAIWDTASQRMYLWGGDSPVAIDELDEVMYFTPTTNTWEKVVFPASVGTPAPSHEHAAVWTGDQLIVWGGAAGNVGFIYKPSIPTDWQQITLNGMEEAIPIASHQSAIWTGKRMIIWGGIDYFVGFLNDGWAFDPTLNFSKLYLYIKL